MAMTTTRFELDGRAVGLLSFAMTILLFSSVLAVHLAGGNAFDPRGMYISDLGAISGWTSVVYGSGMLLLVPLRFLFLLYILSVYGRLGVSKGVRKSLLVLGVFTNAGTAAMSAVSFTLSRAVHMASAFTYFFTALAMQVLFFIAERRRDSLPRILPVSSLLNVACYAFFLAALILSLSFDGFPEFLATLSEWLILVTLMFWLVAHSLCLRADEGPEAKR